MTCVASRFNMKYFECFEGLQVNFLTLVMIIAIIPSECALSIEGHIFHRYENASTDVCSLEDPSHVLNNVRSKQECVLLCQGDPRCSGVNWKEPSVCEMYFFHPSTFETAPRCAYFSLGENSFVTLFQRGRQVYNCMKIIFVYMCTVDLKTYY